MTQETKGIIIATFAMLFVPICLLFGVLVHYHLNKSMLDAGYVKNTWGNWVPQTMFCVPI